MEIEYRRTWNKSMMVLKDLDPPRDCYELSMLQYNKVPGLLPLETVTENGEICLSYDITGKISLESVLADREVDAGLVKRILEELIHLCRELEKYLLDGDSLILDPEMLFYKGEWEEISFCFLPGIKLNLREEIRNLVEKILERMDHSDQEKTEAAYALYDRLQEENCGLLELQELFFQKKESNEEGTQEELWSESDEWEADIKKERKPDKTNRKSDKKSDKKSDVAQKSPLKYFEILKDKTLQAKEKGMNFSYIEKFKEKKKRGAKQPERIEQSEVSTEKEDLAPPLAYAGLIYLGKGEERDFLLNQTTFFLGRDREAVDGILKSAATSGIQAKILKKEDGYYIEDMNSENGTLINGELLAYKSVRKLEEGDRITFADISYRFLTFCHNSI